MKKLRVSLRAVELTVSSAMLVSAVLPSHVADAQISLSVPTEFAPVQSIAPMPSPIAVAEPIVPTPTPIAVAECSCPVDASVDGDGDVSDGGSDLSGDDEEILEVDAVADDDTLDFEEWYPGDDASPLPDDSALGTDGFVSLVSARTFGRYHGVFHGAKLYFPSYGHSYRVYYECRYQVLESYKQYCPVTKTNKTCYRYGAYQYKTWHADVPANKKVSVKASFWDSIPKGAKVEMRVYAEQDSGDKKGEKVDLDVKKSNSTKIEVELDEQ